MLSREDTLFVQELLCRHTGVALESHHEHLLDSRLSSLARQRQLESAGTLVAMLRAAPSASLLESVIDALTTHETSFFRDQQPFVALSEQVLPELVDRRRGTRELSIWSAGCATGQEPYSLAILLREKFAQLTDWKIRILASDISRATIQRARDGLYDVLEARRGLSDAVRAKYFSQEGKSWRVNPCIRRMVSWEVLNLAAAWPALGRFDLILMRNVLIYFSQATRGSILERAAALLRNDGRLLLGSSETTFGTCSAFEPELVRGTTLYRKVLFRNGSARPGASAVRKP